MSQQTEILKQFKENVHKKAVGLNFTAETDKIKELLEYVFEYAVPESATTVTTEKQSAELPTENGKNQPKLSCPKERRCLAKLSGGGQCSRRSLKEGVFCGTHKIDRSYGYFNFAGDDDKQKLMGYGEFSTACDRMMSYEVFAVEIQGLVYYIDHHGNVYSTEDVLNDKTNPTVVAKYVKTNTGYSVPEFGLF